jgi:DNA-binding transcriptional MerR regulator
MPAEKLMTLTELAAAVNGWCADHGIVPANGQAADELNERNIRFYRTAGLVDGPDSGGGRGYGEKHRLQLTGIRLLQAEGLPLRRIRELIFGRSLDELREIERRGAADWRQRLATRAAVPPAGAQWAAHELDAEFLLISRRGRQLPPETLTKIKQLLSTHP